MSEDTLTHRTLGVSWTSITRLEQHIIRLHDERKVMTQSSPSRTMRGMNRPVLALAFGTAAAATVLAPVASMAAAAPTYNDSTKAAGTIKAPAKVGGATAALQTKRTTALPATAFPVPVTGTAYGDAQSQALTASAGAKKTALTNAYTAWKTAATPVVNAWIAYTKAAPAKKAAALKVYNTRLATYNKKAAGTLTNGAAKWTAYSTAYNAWLPVYNTQLAAVKSNHFKLIAGSYGGDASTPANLCTSADNMTAAYLHNTVGATRIGVNDGDPNDNNYIIRCNGGRLQYYLFKGSDQSVTNPYVPAWEYLSASITVSGGQITAVNTATDSSSTSLTLYTPVITDYTSGAHSATPWTLAQLPQAKKPDFNTYALNLLNKSGAFDQSFAGAATPGYNCISAATGATLTCLTFQKSLQQSITAALRGMPY
jgi:hypothetical protein